VSQLLSYACCSALFDLDAVVLVSAARCVLLDIMQLVLPLLIGLDRDVQKKQAPKSSNMSNETPNENSQFVHMASARTASTAVTLHDSATE
jgi:hypothetical protein